MTPAIPKGWRRLRESALIRTGDRWYDATDRAWLTFTRNGPFGFIKTDVVIRRVRKARKRKLRSKN